MGLAILSGLAILVLGVLLVPDDAYTDINGDYCYNQDMEGYICFETRNACEAEQSSDMMSISQCNEIEG